MSGLEVKREKYHREAIKKLISDKRVALWGAKYSKAYHKQYGKYSVLSTLLEASSKVGGKNDKLTTFERYVLDKIESEEEKYNRLVELNVQEQCVNMIKTSDVQHAYRERGVTVHGWVFDIHSGNLIDLKIDFREVLDGIRQIYHLD